MPYTPPYDAFQITNLRTRVFRKKFIKNLFSLALWSLPLLFLAAVFPPLAFALVPIVLVPFIILAYLIRIALISRAEKECNAEWLQFLQVGRNISGLDSAPQAGAKEWIRSNIPILGENTPIEHFFLDLVPKLDRNTPVQYRDAPEAAESEHRIRLAVFTLWHRAFAGGRGSPLTIGQMTIGNRWRGLAFRQVDESHLAFCLFETSCSGRTVNIASKAWYFRRRPQMRDKMGRKHRSDDTLYIREIRSMMGNEQRRASTFDGLSGFLAGALVGPPVMSCTLAWRLIVNPFPKNDSVEWRWSPHYGELGCWANVHDFISERQASVDSESRGLEDQEFDPGALNAELAQLDEIVHAFAVIEVSRTKSPNDSAPVPDEPGTLRSKGKRL